MINRSGYSKNAAVNNATDQHRVVHRLCHFEFPHIDLRCGLVNEITCCHRITSRIVLAMRSIDGITSTSNPSL